MTKRTQRREGAKFVQYFGPILDALRQLGGSGTPAEVANKIAENLNISEEEQTELLKSGTPRFANQVAWARNYLKLEGYIDSSQKGVWVLTETGKKARLSYEDAHKLFLKWVAIHQESRQQKQKISSQEEVVENLNEEVYQDYREELLSILKQLPAMGFENLCQRLMRIKS